MYYLKSTEVISDQFTSGHTHIFIGESITFIVDSKSPVWSWESFLVREFSSFFPYRVTRIEKKIRLGNLLLNSTFQLSRLILHLVGSTGFEPATSASRMQPTRLIYNPKKYS